MGQACGLYRGEKKFLHSFGWETYRKETVCKTCVGERMILKRVLKKWVGRAWTRLMWLTKGTSDGPLLTWE